MKTSAFLLALWSGLAAAIAGPPESAVPRGDWGGDHVSLRVSEAGAKFQFDCAHGTVSTQLSVESDGRFRWSGVLVKEHGGPIRIGERENEVPTVYSGRVRGKSMRLSVTGGGEDLGVYELELGSAGRVVRCR